VPTLYGLRASGNCYKLQLLLDMLGRPYRWIETDSTAGATRTAEFLALNPNGKVPLLVLDDGSRLAESNAILCYLAEGTPFLPADSWERARTLQWMFFEQYSHEPFIATVRFWKHFLPKLSPLQEMELPGRMEKGYAALGVMEQHLGRHQFFVGGQYGLADIALYAYTHVAGEGDFNLDNYPQVNAWMARVAQQPGHVTIDHKN
jgi:glutathione S-transferase